MTAKRETEMREALERELAKLEAANEAATSWGAAVGARSERIKEIRSTLASLSPSAADAGAEAVAWHRDYVGVYSKALRTIVYVPHATKDRALKLLATPSPQPEAPAASPVTTGEIKLGDMVEMRKGTPYAEEWRGVEMKVVGLRMEPNGHLWASTTEGEPRHRGNGLYDGETTDIDIDHLALLASRAASGAGEVCPTCGSTAPHMHPAIQHEGEVELCTDAFHLRPTSQNTPEYIAAVKVTPQQPAVAMGREELAALIYRHTRQQYRHVPQTEPVSFEDAGGISKDCCRACADEILALCPSPAALDAGTVEAYAEVVRLGDAIYNNEANDIQDRRAVSTFVDRFRARASLANGSGS